MLILCYDTETTGIIRGDDYTLPSNPHLASVAALLYDTVAHKVVSSFNVMIYPDGWVMPKEASEINGLSTEYLSMLGIPFDVAMRTFIALAQSTDVFVAHNTDFDTKIIAASLWRLLTGEGKFSDDQIHSVIKSWLGKPVFCTMRESKDIVQAKTKNGKIKYPKLTEAYEFFFNKPLDRAHSANADAVAVLEIFLAIQDHKAINETPNETPTRLQSN